MARYPGALRRPSKGQVIVGNTAHFSSLITQAWRPESAARSASSSGSRPSSVQSVSAILPCRALAGRRGAGIPRLEAAEMTCRQTRGRVRRKPTERAHRASSAPLLDPPGTVVASGPARKVTGSDTRASRGEPGFPSRAADHRRPSAIAAVSTFPLPATACRRCEGWGPVEARGRRWRCLR